MDIWLERINHRGDKSTELLVDNLTSVLFCGFWGVQVMMSSAKILKTINTRVKFCHAQMHASFQRLLNDKTSSKLPAAELNHTSFLAGQVLMLKRGRAELLSECRPQENGTYPPWGSWEGWAVHNVSAAFQADAIQSNQAPPVRGQCWTALYATQLYKSVLFTDKTVGVFTKIK